MQHELPPPEQVLTAVRLYMAAAYALGAAPSAAVTAALASLSAATGERFYSASAFARANQPDRPASYSLRLGNRFYPHMKLVIEPAPTGAGYLFKADTHDRHIAPAPGSAEHAAFMELRARNQKLAEQIEQSWADAGLPTFKGYLLADLARRRSEGQPPAHYR